MPCFIALSSNVVLLLGLLALLFVAFVVWQVVRGSSENSGATDATQSSSGVTGQNTAGTWSTDAPEEDSDEDSGPMISFVLLQRNPKYIEDVTLTKMVESAWGGDYSSPQEGDEDEPSGDGFIIGESPLFVIQSKHGMYLVHNHEQTYWNDMESLLPEIHDLRLRKAVADHTAWLSVDLINPTDFETPELDKSDSGEPDPAKFYPRIARLIVDLADEDTLAIFRPDSTEINIWTEELAEKMLAPDAWETFSESTNVPVIEISDDDPDMIAAVTEAKETWPEFVAAFNEKAEECSNFGAKVKMTVDGETEFIWLEVIGLEPRYVHGKLANDPVALGDLKLGSQVEVPLEDVQDWCYLKNDEPVGLFSLAAIQKSQERRE